MVDFEVTESKEFSDYLPLAMRIEKKYKVDISASDDNPSYGKYIIANQHVASKAETALVECYNSLLRHYLARFNRRTKRYSKAIDMIKNSILLLFNNPDRLNQSILIYECQLNYPDIYPVVIFPQRRE